ncbi:MAG: 30S ribosomal protein S6--L-glutamate ligase [Rickettsiales bacterium]|nr:30S ribosomal protein S6--L-glutamate ligase [Rickettsiales bacterium]
MVIGNKTVIGQEEWCALPDIGLPAIKARVDSGAKTSSLHAVNIRTKEEGDDTYVTFDVHPIQKSRAIKKRCRAKLMDRRKVKSSSGQTEQRYVIQTPVTIGDTTWMIDVTLTNRDDMGYRMLLGRQAMENRFLVDPARSFLTVQMNDQDARLLYKSVQPSKRKLKILLLASNPSLYSNMRIMEAGEQRGHEMLFVNIRHCYMNIGANNAVVHYRGGEAFEDVDAVIPRIKPSVTHYGCSVLRHFQAMGGYCLNDSIAIARSRDKLRTLQVLAGHGIDMPITGFASSPQDTKDMIKIVGGAPLVVKLLEGTQGRGVVLAETNKAAESVINAFKSLNANILVQEFVKEAQGSDIRCFVVDGKVVGSMQRTAQEGEFRANLHLGGTASSVRITPTERKIAARVAKIMGLKVAGVDIIRSASGPKVLEVNSSPGLEGVEQVTGKDIAGLMIESIEKKLEK